MTTIESKPDSAEPTDQHPDLITAFRALRSRHVLLERNLSHGRRWLWISIGVLVVLLTAVDLIHWWWVDRDIAEEHRRIMASKAVSPAPGGSSGSGDLFTVATRHVSQHLGLVGKVASGSIVNITAPFSGSIVKLGFTYGARVTKGQMLVQLDTTELESKQRTSRVVQIQARDNLNALQDWASSSEVAGARRSLESAKQRLSEARSRAEANKGLFREGIISREELESAQNQHADAARSTAAADEALEAAQRKGDKDNLLISRLKLENAEYQLKQILSELAQAEVRSPVDGVALLPREVSGRSTKTIAVGTHVDSRQVLLAVGDMESLKIIASVSELDINSLVPGLGVEITGEALGKIRLQGKVSTVGSQAIEGRDRALAYYPVTVILQVPNDVVRERIRLGMHVELRVAVYESPEAMVVPETAISGDEGAYEVKRLDPKSNQLVSTPVEIGRPLPEGIEIIKGLSPGDRIQRDLVAKGGRVQ